MNTTIGKRIAAARDLAGLSQKEVAYRMGLSKSLISHWERGARIPRINQAKQLAKILDVEPEKILMADTASLTPKLQTVI